jgi:hypothetical protein
MAAPRQESNPRATADAGVRACPGARGTRVSRRVVRSMDNLSRTVCQPPGSSSLRRRSLLAVVRHTSPVWPWMGAGAHQSATAWRTRRVPICQFVEADSITRHMGSRPRSFLPLRPPALYPWSRPNARIARVLLSIGHGVRRCDTSSHLPCHTSPSVQDRLGAVFAPPEPPGGVPSGLYRGGWHRDCSSCLRGVL